MHPDVTVGGKSIQGVLVDESVSPAIRKAVQLQILAGEIHVKPAPGVQDVSSSALHILSRAGLQFELGGNRNSLLFIKSPRLSQITLYCDARSEHLKIFEGLPAFDEKMHQFKKQNKKSLFVVSSGIALLIALFVALVYFRGPIFGGIGTLVPFAFEKKIAEKVFGRSLSQQQKDLEVQLGQFLSVLKFDPKTWSEPFVFHLTSEETPNAFATLGGHVFITKGLFQVIKTPEELLGVVAHEMVHVQRRHVARSVFQAVGMFGMIQLIFGDVSGILAVFLDQGGPLLNLQFSRALEEEADALGIQLLEKNGINPIGLAESLDAIRLYQKKIREQQPGSEILSKIEKIEILMSHPEVEKRIEHLRKQAQNFQSKQKQFVDRATFEKIKKKSQEVF